MTLGPTHWRWRADVERVVLHLEATFPRIRCNTYVAHPWEGWDGQSIDVWGAGGRGDPLPLETGHKVVREAFNLSWGPFLRHYIYLNTLWTSFGGLSTWAPNDHRGKLRHVHFTYW
jgi:hypothetical protein